MANKRGLGDTRRVPTALIQKSCKGSSRQNTQKKNNTPCFQPDDEEEKSNKFPSSNEQYAKKSFDGLSESENPYRAAQKPRKQDDDNENDDEGDEDEDEEDLDEDESYEEEEEEELSSKKTSQYIQRYGLAALISGRRNQQDQERKIKTFTKASSNHTSARRPGKKEM
jgi:hypothetical protein